MGKGVVDEHSPQCLGTAALSSDDYIHCASDRADLVINVRITSYNVCYTKLLRPK